MAGKPAKSDKEKAQLERFKAKAKELGANEDPEAFDVAFKRVIRRDSNSNPAVVKKKG